MIESQPLLEGRNMTMVLGPTRNAGEKVKAEAEHKSDERAGNSGQAVAVENASGAEDASAES